MGAHQVIPGQRWVSDTEPELGLGIILKEDFGRVEVFFPAAGENRQYALRSAPLRRVRFREGDRIQSHDGRDLFIDAVDERDGLLVYKAGGSELAEAELSDSISFSKPEERLLGGQVDDLRTFELRVKTLIHQSRIRKSAVRGFAGARIDLIPHQLSVASDVAARLLPRVLLADEVGLGKTIEAALILHRLHLTGRAERVLILVPEPLVHQWFVELLRRFNLLFSIFDEERCAAIEAHDAEANPFLDSQLVLCSIGFLAGTAGEGEKTRGSGSRRGDRGDPGVAGATAEILVSPERPRSGNDGEEEEEEEEARERPNRAAQALAAGWDLLIVDEAHHLEWTPEAASPQYALVESLSRVTDGLLLLTATPQQLGPEGHFARLRLLDPDRYTDLDRFQEEAEHYEEVAAAVDRLIGGRPLSEADRNLFGAKSARIRAEYEKLAAGDESARGRLIEELLDEFGTGRVMFRNARAALSGFPERKASLIPVECGPDGDMTGAKIKWLAGLLKSLGEAEKILLICRTRALAEEISERLQREIKVRSALFHEGLTLLERDRNAAFFAEEEAGEGARILICSEIGSEGRNFQFAHHLVLFDLPPDPELLEQRIGRLDRIGQTAAIRIHVPFVPRTESEVLARWYHDGLGAFEKSLHGALEIVRALGAEVESLRGDFDAAALKKLVVRSRAIQKTVAKKLERGHDRLLELNSCKGERAKEIIREIRALDIDEEFEEFLLAILDQFGIEIEDIGRRSYLIKPGNLITDAFPSLPEEGLAVTFDRARALGREDAAFMSRDHPIVRGAMDLYLGSQAGNAAFGVWTAPDQKEAIFLEVHSVIECVAPVSLHVDRFLPATPMRVLVDDEIRDRTGQVGMATKHLLQGDPMALLRRKGVKRMVLPAMLEKAREVSRERMQAIVDEASAAMTVRIQEEIDRLEDLGRINDHVRPEEIAAAKKQKEDLRKAIAGARLRMDALRLIWRVP